MHASELSYRNGSDTKFRIKGNILRTTESSHGHDTKEKKKLPNIMMAGVRNSSRPVVPWQWQKGFRRLGSLKMVGVWGLFIETQSTRGWSTSAVFTLQQLYSDEKASYHIFSLLSDLVSSLFSWFVSFHPFPSAILLFVLASHHEELSH